MPGIFLKKETRSAKGCCLRQRELLSLPQALFAQYDLPAASIDYVKLSAPVVDEVDHGYAV